jgi:hypothetical protein
MRWTGGLLRIGLAVALTLAAGGIAACAGPFGSAPLVLTEVPNRPTGKALIASGAERSGCHVTPDGDANLRLLCPEGELDVPTFTGPPTFAVRCVDDRLQDVARCKALVRKVLLASEGPPPG